MSLTACFQKRFGSFRLCVDLCMGEETLSLLGMSGSGKSLTLRCIAGIEKPDSGFISLNGRALFDSDKHIHLSPQERRTGYLFQNYALFPNMTVFRNVMAGTRRNGKRADAEAEVRTMLKRFRLEDKINLYPRQLSGGEQQRVALARMLISEPDILLLDEPFSALDTHLRFYMEREIKEVIRQFGKSVIFVTHSRDEAFRLSDKIAVMCDGKTGRIGTKEEIFQNPGTKTAAMLTGCKNISPAKILDENRLSALDWGIELETEHNCRETRFVGVRLHDVLPGVGSENNFLCRIAEEIENPFSYDIMLKNTESLSALPFGMELSKPEWEKIRGEEIRVHIPKERVLLLEE